ncbi:MAG: polysaccharide biosynthesis/export family protein [Nitrospira sp.]|jgi:polysaccharide export outer membrane protein|uniref:polysaccharide biosynthesis/export family protein n=1 Tax=Nitrospira sp. ND1 TaxID=1658518 RepID=UPI0009BBA62C|nr:polysaccharide biosynthesis/export family protein [Nitrospira sp. ND1]MBK7421427.1 polysaccharide biosynthesis/export family protein [Nitrospira sp.]OYT23262.1 MAG: sugar transporter [Nitrospira sp. UW-LDO-02]MBK7487689.1 polysaccharide biosynthesis/export family protein [Nitrospira sp.]MBK9112073.1 polysaccharide biosynthesis/export family protein [Nitrospira sp.]MBP6198172.1 polysaccharide biosynthesis/export family protein [Nitrospira sp.]
MNGKALLSGIILVGNVIGVAHAGQFDQVPKPTLVAGPSPGASSSGVRHGGEGAEKSSLTVTPDYIMGPEDVLEITVWKNADLSKQVQVRPDGRISLPLIGDVSAVGRTAAQLTEEISARLKSYMENPTVSILVREVNSYQIYVLGEVNAPGKYPLKSKTTLLQAITIAHGFTQVAARNKIVVFRFGKDGEGLNKIKASYDDIVLRDGSDQNIELKPGDQIVVPSETMVVLPSR